jgi:carboxyl-terminal processing protease
LYLEGRFNNFVYKYYVDNLQEWQKYKTPSEFAEKYTNTEDAWKKLVVFAMKDSINLTKVPEADKQGIEDRIKAYLARFRWRTQGFYEVSNSVDEIVTAAKKEIRK